jgi:TetR/AcrR family transcriptional regulator, mexJK operon transcriptional repressor
MKTDRSTEKGAKREKPLHPNASRVRGRPKDLQLRKRILICARDLFLDHGFQIVAMDAIASSAQVSNRTVYSHFESKEKLLAAVFAFEAERLRPGFSPEEVASSSEFEAGLTEFGEMFVRLLTSHSIQGLGRILVSEATRHPEIVREFYEWGPRETQHRLATFLRLGINRGWIVCENPLTAAQNLLALWLGTWHFEQQLGLRNSLSPAKIKVHVQQAMQVFMYGVSRQKRTTA